MKLVFVGRKLDREVESGLGSRYIVDRAMKLSARKSLFRRLDVESGRLSLMAIIFPDVTFLSFCHYLNF